MYVKRNKPCLENYDSASSFEWENKREEEFQLPDDFSESTVSLGLDYARGAFSANAFHQTFSRGKVVRFGLGATSSTRENGQKACVTMGYFTGLGKSRSLSASLSYLEGWDLDPFSRLQLGERDLTIAGFSEKTYFDKAAITSLGHTTSLFGVVSLKLALEGGRLWQKGSDKDPLDLVGLGATFVINGPWSTDIEWTTQYGLYASEKENEGHLSFGLGISRKF